MIKSRSLILLLTLFCCVSSFAQNNSKKAIQLYEEAFNIFEEIEEIHIEDVHKAIELYKKAIVADEHCVVAYEQLATDYWSIGDQKEALRYIDLGIEKNPTAATLYLIKGVFSEDTQKVDEAKKLYLRSQELFKKNYKPNTMSFDDILYYAITYYLLENQDAAIKKFESLAASGAFNENDYEWFYSQGSDTLANMELTEFLEQSITNKYGLR